MSQWALMPVEVRRYLVHEDGPALWPAHFPLEKILRLKQTTPEFEWETTYQCNATIAGGTIFQEWWFEESRYHIGKIDFNAVPSRYISLDTAEEDSETSAYTAAVIGDLWPDYRLGIRHVERKRMQVPDLEEFVTNLINTYGASAIIIENKSSGRTLIQTLKRTLPAKLARKIVPINPKVGKEERAKEASPWCKNGSVLLPHPDQDALWLKDFEKELWNFPQSTYADQVDAFSQLVLHLQNYLRIGLNKRRDKQK